MKKMWREAASLILTAAKPVPQCTQTTRYNYSVLLNLCYDVPIITNNSNSREKIGLGCYINLNLQCHFRGLKKFKLKNVFKLVFFIY